MKTYHILLTALAALTVFACNQDETDGMQPLELVSINAKIPPYTNTQDTRVVFGSTDGEHPDPHVLIWDFQEKFGLYSDTENGKGGSWFTLTNGIYNKSALFSNSGFKLHPGRKYYALYPYDNQATATHTTFSYTDQQAVSYGSYGGSDERFIYMYGVLKADAQGHGIVEFNHLGALMEIKLHGLPVNMLFSKLEIKKKFPGFNTTAILDMTTGVCEYQDNSSTLTIDLANQEWKRNGYSFANIKGDMVVYLFVPPTDLTNGPANSSVQITLTSKSGVVFTGTADPQNMEKGKIYTFNSDMNCTSLLTDNVFSNHKFVDLGTYNEEGTPVYWATMNVDTPAYDYQPGGYYAWAEKVLHYTKIYSNGTAEWKSGYGDGYAMSTYRYAYGNSFFKYTGSQSYFDDNDKTYAFGEIEPEDDVATQNWGKGWRIPSDYEWNQLIQNCYWELKESYNGTRGWMVYKAKDSADRGKKGSPKATYSSTDDHIFLPDGGYFDGTEHKWNNVLGYYWSSTRGQCLMMAANSITTTPYSRYIGMNIRPVFGD